MVVPLESFSEGLDAQDIGLINSSGSSPRVDGNFRSVVVWALPNKGIRAPQEIWFTREVQIVTCVLLSIGFGQCSLEGPLSRSHKYDPNCPRNKPIEGKSLRLFLGREAPVLIQS
jgi:hypothetical protein